jgi:hypothetical protein
MLIKQAHHWTTNHPSIHRRCSQCSGESVPGFHFCKCRWFQCCIFVCSQCCGNGEGQFDSHWECSDCAVDKGEWCRKRGGFGGVVGSGCSGCFGNDVIYFWVLVVKRYIGWGFGVLDLRLCRVYTEKSSARVIGGLCCRSLIMDG